jgi:predicted PolB exonuclease-like 3'-5' exonuclease
MKHIEKDLYCYDAEWIPCTRTGALLVKLPDSATEDQIIEALWKRAGATPEKPHPFLKLAISRIVSISAIHRRVEADGSVSLALRSYPELANPTVTEGEILTSFLEEVAECGGQMVGFNSANADLPILVQRGIANGCHCPTFGKRPEKPWEGPDYLSRFSEAHLDLATLLKAGGFGSSVMPSLDEIAAACGIPGKLDHAGDGVLELWQRGDGAAITGYNETDACTTYLLWLRTAWFFGKITEEQRDAELAEFNRLLRSLLPTKPHLKRFLDVWRARRKTMPMHHPGCLVQPPSSTLTVLANWAPVHDGRMGPIQGECEISLPLAEIDEVAATKLKPHLKEKSRAGKVCFALCRLGHDNNGQLVKGHDRNDEPLLLSVTTRDLAGVLRAIAQSSAYGVDEWASPEAA